MARRCRVLPSTSSRMSMKTTIAVLTSALALTAGCAKNPQPTTAPSTQRSAAQGGDTAGRAGGDSSARGAGGAAQPRPYNRVITRDARTRRGMFAVHRVNDKLFFEIPRKELGKNMFFAGRYPGQPH